MTNIPAQNNRLLAIRTLEEKWPEYHQKLFQLLIQALNDAPETIFEGTGSFIFETFTDHQHLLCLKVFLATPEYKLTNPIKGCK
jgi:hypothetical protein